MYVSMLLYVMNGANSLIYPAEICSRLKKGTNIMTDKSLTPDIFMHIKQEYAEITKQLNEIHNDPNFFNGIPECKAEFDKALSILNNIKRNLPDKEEKQKPRRTFNIPEVMSLDEIPIFLNNLDD